MTAQEINHIANLAAQRASVCTDYSADRWDAAVTLKRMAHTIAAREIEAQGYSNLYAPLTLRGR